jgi:hypothetical protein
MSEAEVMFSCAMSVRASIRGLEEQVRSARAESYS